MSNRKEHSVKAAKVRMLVAVLVTLVIALLLVVKSSLSQDIQGLIVETYYISDANDATDEVGGTLAEGSITYRVFLDLDDGVSLKKIFANECHSLRIEGEGNFFNNVDRGENFGFEIGDNRLDENTVALDSWFSFGGGSDEHWGVPKDLDTDGSIVGGVNNDGGSAEIAGGLLVNEDDLAGIPLTEADGLLLGVDLEPANFFTSGDDVALAFGDETLTSIFETTNFSLLAGDGVTGQTEENIILIGQFTTTGELTFELNVEVVNEEGVTIPYVASDTCLVDGEIVSPFLKFPPECGCIDPDYLEFDPSAGCDDGSCLTPVVLGCSDPEACNYNPQVNFNVPELCCILPDNCVGLDPEIICPGFVGIENEFTFVEFNMYPVPVSDILNLEFNEAMQTRTSIVVHDAQGREVIRQQIASTGYGQIVSLNLQNLERGTYVFSVAQGGFVSSKLFVKS